MSKTKAVIFTTFAALAAPACEKKDFLEPMVLGGQTVTAETLNAGRESYMLNCYACHGEQGDGKGPSAPGLRPPPRDFRTGTFKFAAVAGGQLPNDADLLRIVKGGLHGTPMLPWDITDMERTAVIQYIKTFSPKWKTEKPGDPIVTPPDPWMGKEKEAIERGDKVYHGQAQCAVACHPAYSTRQQIADATKELSKIDVTQFRDDMYLAIAKDSDDYQVDGKKIKFLPPDFLFNRLRSGETLPDIYRVIASGIGGTAMPTWKGVLPDADLWAMTHFVGSLVAKRGTPAAAELKARLAAQAAWTPPPPAPEEVPPPEVPAGKGKAKPAAGPGPKKAG